MSAQVPGLEIKYPDTMNLRIAALFLNLSEGRLRALVREGKVVGEQVEGVWSFKKADLEVYNAAPKVRATPTGGKAAKAGKAFIVHIVGNKVQAVKEALAAQGVELEQRYDYSKQRAYRTKRNAALKATKAAKAAEAAKNAPAPVPTNTPVPTTAPAPFKHV